MTGVFPRDATAGPGQGDAAWSAALHWAVRTIPTDHPDLAFAAELLSRSVERGGLGPRQQKWARSLLAAVEAEGWLEDCFAPVGSPSAKQPSTGEPGGNVIPFSATRRRER